MRPYPFTPATAPSSHPDRGGEPAPAPAGYDPYRPEPGPGEGGGGGGGGGPGSNLPVPYRRSRWRWPVRIAGVGVVLFVLAVIWLAFTAPLSKSLEPLTPPSITLLASDGTPIARRGAIIGPPVDAAQLPANVTNAFLAIEDRRFKSHWGVDPRGIARAFWHNVTSDGRNQGGSTITQQLAKNAFLDSDRTAARKIREVMIAFWLEAWLSKDEILSRYLSNVYFGDNVYGLAAAAKHYFNRAPEDLSIAQAAMLAGLVKAPSKLAPTVNIEGARARQKLVVAAMADGGFITAAEAAAVRPARLATNRIKPLPDGTYFADWVLPEARDRAGEIAQETTVKTTLDRRLQTAAERVVRGAGLREAQVALVAMHPDGRVVAMVGGKDYKTSAFNRAVQARRQSGSTFKLFVYLAALRSGLTPESTIEDEPVTIADWSPKNSDGRYAGTITLRRAFAKSSNVAAARLTQQVGVKNVIRAARDLGITTPIPNEATIALGSATGSLLELTSAYAAIAAQSYPVRARGVEQEGNRSWYQSLTDRARPLTGTVRDNMLDLLSASAETGTGRQAALAIKTYGKTGTTSDNRDALFVGFAGDLVVGVWVGNDDNTSNAGLSGGGLPARIWRDFMMRALKVGPAVAPEPEPAVVEDEDGNGFGFDDLGVDGVQLPEGEIEGLGLNLRVGPDGGIEINRARGRDRDRDRDEGRRDDRRREDRALRDEEPPEDEF
ncbi:transglycosylase domain-containing protein [Sphingomonas hylomeconis]|uniref:peptidoglycan glycosyltransferase n=1 Tax=Sphingomonas hylomeconis TaxID=1395958 RepID=A0ABV7SPA9_9SPHN|nr:PBP1A family penicillin-binding protein [Sphingomonas hylomeconis]